MSSNSKNNKRIAKNTAFLYFRTFITMAISIYTSRVVLDALGIEDYGIYNVVGGFVAMLSMFVNSLSASSQRFFAYEMGQEKPQLSKVFSVTISVHLIITLAIFLFFETIGLWFLNIKMNIPEDRMVAANWVFQCSVFSFSINMVSIPYLASIIAHEHMGAFAFMSIYEAFAKLGLAFLLTVYFPDRLVVYSIGMLLIALSLRIIYSWFCRVHFPECRFKFLYDKVLYGKLLSFTGWNVFGASAGIINTYGINILVNLFFGVTLNAARGIADQVSHAVNSFAGNFTMAMNPQITKSFSACEYTYTSTLICKGAKYSALLLWIISMPIIFHTDFILSVWLVDVPEYASIFVKLVLIYTMCNTLSLTLYYGILATGEIKAYHIVVTTINLLAFPICYFAFLFDLGVEWSYWSAIIAMFLSLIARIVMLKRKLPFFSIRQYIGETLFRVIMVSALSYLLFTFIKDVWLFHSDLVSFIISSASSIFITLIIIIFVGLNNKEREKIYKVGMSLLSNYCNGIFC